MKRLTSKNLFFLSSLLITSLLSAGCGSEKDAVEADNTPTQDSDTDVIETEYQLPQEGDTEETNISEMESLPLTLVEDNIPSNDVQTSAIEGSIEIDGPSLSGTVDYMESLNDEIYCTATLKANGEYSEDGCPDWGDDFDTCYLYTLTVLEQEGDCRFEAENMVANLSDEGTIGFIATDDSWLYIGSFLLSNPEFGGYEGWGYEPTEGSIDISNEVNNSILRLDEDCFNMNNAESTNEKYLGSEALQAEIPCVDNQNLSDVWAFDAEVGDRISVTVMAENEESLNVLLVSPDQCLDFETWMGQCGENNHDCHSLQYDVEESGSWEIMVVNTWCDGALDYQIDAKIQ